MFSVADFLLFVFFAFSYYKNFLELSSGLKSFNSHDKLLYEPYSSFVEHSQNSH